MTNKNPKTMNIDPAIIFGRLKYNLPIFLGLNILDILSIAEYLSKKKDNISRGIIRPIIYAKNIIIPETPSNSVSPAIPRSIGPLHGESIIPPKPKTIPKITTLTGSLFDLYFPNFSDREKPENENNPNNINTKPTKTTRLLIYPKKKYPKIEIPIPNIPKVKDNPIEKNHF